MKGSDLALSITSSTSSVVEQYIDLQNKYQYLLAENDSLKVENEILKAIAGE